MKKKMSKFIVSLLTVAMIFGVALPVSAASSEDAELDGVKLNGFVDITDEGASAQTSINALPEDSSTTVTLSYSYLNTKTNEITTIKKVGIGRNLANITIRKPSEAHYISLGAVATHNVAYSYAGQKWAAHTEAKMATIPLIPLFKSSN